MDKRFIIIFGVVAFLLITSGTFAPGWMVYSLDSMLRFLESSTDFKTGVTVHQGLFLIVATGNRTEVSSVYNFEQAGHETYLGVLEYQIEACLGVFFCIAALICTLLYNETKDSTYLYKPILFFFVAGGASWVAIGRWLAKLIPAGKLFDMETPYSLVLCGIGGVINLVCMGITIALYRQDDRLRNPHTKVIYDAPLTPVNTQNQQPGYYSAVPPADNKL